MVGDGGFVKCNGERLVVNQNHPRAAGSSQDGADVKTAGHGTVTSQEVGQPREAPGLVP